MLFKIAPAALLLLAATASNEPYVQSTVSAGDLVQECSKPRQQLQADFCTGYILATFDTLSSSRLICPRGGGSGTLQAVAVANKYLNDHPELWDRAPSYLLATAFKQVFPCG